MGPVARLIVTGCAAKIDPAAFAAMREVDLVLGKAEKAAQGAYLPTEARVRVNGMCLGRETAGHLNDGLNARDEPKTELKSRQ